MDIRRPRIGIGILVIDEEKILIGKRKDCQLFGIPGGHLELFETWEQCASRELKEETNLSVPDTDLRVVKIYNALNKPEDYHNVAIILACRFPKDQEIKNMEPDKCEGWEWWTIKEFFERKDALFFPNKLLVDEYKEVLSIEYLSKFLDEVPRHKTNFYF